MKTAEELREERMAMAKEKEALTSDDQLYAPAVLEAVEALESYIRDMEELSQETKEEILSLIDDTFEFLWNPETDDDNDEEQENE